jgi:uncharacterized membrane protein
MVLDKASLHNRLVLAVILSNLFAIALVVNRVLFSESYRYLFLLWNILLAALPAILAVWLVRRIRKHGWLKPKQILLTFLWLAFLPNSFYLLTDFIHLRQTFEADILYDIVLLASFLINGLILGYISLVVLHRELIKRVSSIQAASLILLTLFLSSFAIYLGRFTRWNTWDLLLQPAGLLFDVSDRFVNPGAHPQTFSITLLLFVFLSVIYFVVWEAVNYSAASGHKQNNR